MHLNCADYNSKRLVNSPAPPLSPPSPVMPERKEQTKIDGMCPIHASEGGEDAIDERKLLRKIDWHLIPALTALFLLSFLDRSNGKPFFLHFLVLPFRSLSFSWKCSYRGSSRRYTYEYVYPRCPQLARLLPSLGTSRKPVPHHINHLLHRLRLVRGPV